MRNEALAKKVLMATAATLTFFVATAGIFALVFSVLPIIDPLGTPSQNCPQSDYIPDTGGHITNVRIAAGSWAPKTVGTVDVANKTVTLSGMAGNWVTSDGWQLVGYLEVTADARLYLDNGCFLDGWGRMYHQSNYAYFMVDETVSISGTNGGRFLNEESGLVGLWHNAAQPLPTKVVGTGTFWGGAEPPAVFRSWIINWSPYNA